MADKRQDGSNRGMPTLSLHGAPSSHRTSPSHRTSSSYRTSSSRKSGSSAALVVATQKAKAEEARVRLEYIRQETDMLRQQAEMEARHQKERTELAIDLKVLETQRELKEAEAGLEALNESIENESEKFSGNLELDDEMLNVKQERTEQYVKDMQNIDREPMNSRNSEPMNNRNPEPDSKPEPDSTAKELTKYIMKKDMIMSKFYKFNDKPERYCMWKASFKNIITEMDLAASEELDLMCRWLGPQSSGQACSLRAANCGREASAIDKIWERLDCRYGAPELIVQSLQERLSSFTKLTTKDSEKLYELSDLLNEIDSLKQDEQYKAALAYLDSSAGVNPIVSQLPSFMQGKWTDRAMKFKKDHSVLFPPFAVFTEYVTNMASRANDPSFRFDTPISKPSWNNAVRKQEQATAYRNTVSARKTCVIHGETAKHTLKECRTFQMKPIAEKKEIIKQNGICFKCCDGKHLAKDCTVDVTCEKCGSTRHCTEFHLDRSYGGEPTNTRVTTACTEVCGDVGFQGKSCAKTVLVNIYPEGKPHRALKTYAIVDDQSNRTLARTEFFQHFNENCEEIEYTLSSCSGKVSTSGRRAQSYVIESMDGNTTFKCPSLIECNEIPNERHEIPTPTVARQYEHLKGIEHLIPEYDPQAEILSLIGRDMISAHHVLDQRLGSDNEPYAQRLKLGWVIVGETCLQMVHMTETISVKKTYIHNDGYETVLKPCPNSFQLTSKPIDVFETTPDDEDSGLSREDRDFLKIMDKEFTKSPDGNWSAPLPFRKDRPRLPDNYQQARNRAQSLARSLKRDPVKEGHFVEFMKNIFENKHAEVAPPVAKEEERWYLPIFGVYHPKKKSKIRVVFDSAAKHEGISLNDVLLTGPDLTNNLVGVLLKFRKEKIAVTADVEQMFFNFQVHEEHRNMLRFIWFKDNDPRKEMIEYRMRVHVFGNSPSPAVATYGLRKSVCDHEDDSSCDEICEFVKTNFYVDDALVSGRNEEKVIRLVKNSQQRLNQGGNIRLHKITSNSAGVLASFDPGDLSKDLAELGVNTETASVQRSLELSWDIGQDVFTYQVADIERPYTKRGMLSTVHSIFDPMGFVAPAILTGRLLMKEAIRYDNNGWDEPLSDKMESDWKEWVQSLKDLETIKIPRAFTDISLEESTRRELHMFSDASKAAIGAAGYLKVHDINGRSNLAFILGKSKVAPSHGHTIPRLELCAAVLAAELSRFIKKHLAVPIDVTHFYSDSQVVLGYINNETRRFHIYVGNRVDKILNVSSKTQWHYVPTEANPADEATRPLKVGDLMSSKWLKGPEVFLDSCESSNNATYALVKPDTDKEIRPEVKVCKMSVFESRLGNDRFKRFSTWIRLTSAISRLKQKASVYHQDDAKNSRNSLDFQKEAELLVLREVQNEMYPSEIDCLKDGQPLPRNSSLLALSPVLDKNGLLRIGGRIKNAEIATVEKNPIIIPGKHHIATLLVRHFHETIRHQGRHLTEGAIRSAGYWVIGGKRLINSVLRACVKCKRLRGKFEQQKMAELPSDRLTQCPPFTYVGVDTFGPWSVTSRRTRGGSACSKRWAIMFSCLVTRGIHIEVVEELSSSSFINALRRFISLRGPVKEFRSDRGTNFVGATDDLGISAINVEDKDIGTYLLRQGVVWKFNSPYSSHMSGAWERMIGLTRRILDAMLLDTPGKQLTHEVLCTLMAEVCAIINSRPITTVSTDPEFPSVLSPSILITQKVNADVDDVKSFENLSVKDMYRSQWRHAQVLANQFWKKWSGRYLQGLQSRTKWPVEHRNLKVGDVILMVDNTVSRNQWPVGTVEAVFPSSDGLVRKVSIRVIRGNEPATFIRPVTQLVHLFSE